MLEPSNAYNLLLTCCGARSVLLRPFAVDVSAVRRNRAMPIDNANAAAAATLTNECSPTLSSPTSSFVSIDLVVVSWILRLTFLLPHFSDALGW